MYKWILFGALAVLSACGDLTAVVDPLRFETLPHINQVALAARLDNDTLPRIARRTQNPTPPEPPRAARRPVRRSSGGPAVQGTGACGGDLPSCAIMRCESGGTLNRYNAGGSGANGKWQFMDDTWNGMDGNKRDGGYHASDGKTYAHAADAPEHVQDEAARKLWNGGRGRGNWEC